MKHRQRIDGTAAATMIALCLIWGTRQVAIKLAAADMTPVLQVGLRSVLAALVMLCVIGVRGELHELGKGMWRPGLIVGALFALEFILFAEGLRFTSASHMSIFLYTAPVFAALGLHFAISEERLTLAQWAGIALAFCGIMITFSAGSRGPGMDNGWIGDTLGLLAGAAWGMTTLVVRTTRLTSAPATVTLFYQLAGAGVLATMAAFAFGQTEVTISSTLVTSFLYQALVISVASYLAWFALLRRYLASRLGILSLFTPLFGILFGVAILGDVLTDNFLVGAIAMIGGVFLVSGADWIGHRKVVDRHADA